MTTTLEAWTEKFGDNSRFTESNRIGFDYQLNVVYPVEVKAAKIIENKRKETVLLLDLLVQNADRTEQLGTSREWLTIPKQPTDEKLSNEIVRKITLRRRDDLQRILSTVDSYAAVFTTREIEDGKPVYKNENGDYMTPSELRAREKEVNEYVMSVSDDWHDAVGKPIDYLENARFFLVKAPNKTKPQYPYTNVYNVRPANKPLIGEEQDAPF